MGRIDEGWRGARTVGGYVLELPFASRRAARAPDRDGAMAELQGLARRYLERAGIEVVVSGADDLPTGGCVLNYNETAAPDVLVLNGYLWGFADHGAAAPVWGRLPWVRAAGERIGLAILPQNRRDADALLDRFAAAAADGRRVMWGGEGRLSGVDGVRPFKTGGARIAIRGGVPIVPTALRGSHRIQPLGSVRMRPGTVRVAFGRPIPTEGLTEDDATRLAERSREAVAALYESLG